MTSLQRAAETSTSGNLPKISPRVLVVSVSHGLPATQPRPERAYELGRHLTAGGALVDQVVLLEKALQPPERDRVARVVAVSHDCVVLEHPSFATAWGRFLSGLGDFCGLRSGLGSECPSKHRRRVGTAGERRRL